MTIHSISICVIKLNERIDVCRSDVFNEALSHRIMNTAYAVRWGRVEDVVKSLQKNLSGERIQLSENIVVDMLQRFGDDWKSALGFFQWADLQQGYKHRSDAYTKMVDVLGKSKQMYTMWVLVHDMNNKGFITLQTISKVLRRLVAAGRWQEAIRTFDDIESLGLTKDTETINILLDTLCKEKKVEVARQVFLQYRSDFVPDCRTFNIFVHGWCLLRRIDDAEKAIVEMKQNGIVPSVVTYSNILRAHCDLSNFCKVFELMDEMISVGCPPNTTTYTSVITSLGRLGKIEPIFKIIVKMKSTECKPDIFFFNSLISILGRIGEIHEARRIFDVEMRENGVLPDITTYNTMIAVYCQNSQGREALNILRKMEEEKNPALKPNLHTFGPLFKLILRLGNADKILISLLDGIVNKHHLFLDSDTYSQLIHGFCKVGKVEGAFLLIEEMVSRDIFPKEKKTLDLLLSEAERRGFVDTSQWIKELIKRHCLYF